MYIGRDIWIDTYIHMLVNIEKASEWQRETGIFLAFVMVHMFLFVYIVHFKCLVCFVATFSYAYTTHMFNSYSWLQWGKKCLSLSLFLSSLFSPLLLCCWSNILVSLLMRIMKRIKHSDSRLFYSKSLGFLVFVMYGFVFSISLALCVSLSLYIYIFIYISMCLFIYLSI